MAISVSQIELPYPIEQVWRTLTDLTCQEWRSDIESVEITGETTFIEHTKGGMDTFFMVTQKKPPEFQNDPQKAFWTFNMENENMVGHWIGELVASANGCLVTFTEEAEVKKFWMRPFVKLYLRKQQRQHIADLCHVLEQV